MSRDLFEWREVVSSNAVGVIVKRGDSDNSLMLPFFTIGADTTQKIDDILEGDCASLMSFAGLMDKTPRFGYFEPPTLDKNGFISQRFAIGIFAKEDGWESSPYRLAF